MASPGVTQMEEQLEQVEDVVEDVFPALVGTAVFSALLLVMFVVRVYCRWAVPCPSDNRLDGKTVIITGEYKIGHKTRALPISVHGSSALKNIDTNCSFRSC